MNISAIDQGVDRKTVFATLQININDMNDNSPQLLPPFDFSVPEDASVASEIGILKASDADMGANADLSFSIFGNSTEFIINQTGSLTIRRQLDREKTSGYSLNYRVSDKGTPPRMTSGVLKIDVVDVNDNNPVFDSSEYNCSVSENAPSPAVVCFVSATDVDEGSNAEISYSIEGVSTSFKIDEVRSIFSKLWTMNSDIGVQNSLKLSPSTSILSLLCWDDI